MSDELGRLLLYLGAPTNTLESDLGKAQQLITKYHAKWQKQVGNLAISGIAGSLNGEMATAEAVLDRSLRQMKQRTAQHKIRVAIEVVGLDESGLANKLSKLTGRTIKVKTDLSELHALNKLLDVKIRHIQQTQQVFSRVVITPRVDLTGLHQLNKELDQALGKLSQLQKTSGASVPSQNSRQSIAINSDGLSKDIAASIQKGFKDAQPNKLLQAAGKVTEAATAPFAAVARGALEGFGREMTRGLSGGLVDSLQAAASGSIGSADLVGQKIGDKIAAGISNNLGKNLRRELEAEIRDALGAVNVDRESGVITQARQQRQGTRTSQGVKGLNTQRQNVERERIEAAAELSEVEKRLSGLNSYKDRAVATVDTYSRSEFNARLSGDGSLAKLAQRQLRESRRTLAQIEELEANLELQSSQLKAKIEKLGTKRARLTQSIDALSPQQPAIVQQIADAVAGKPVASSDLPRIMTADARLAKLGGTAAYNPVANTISVNGQLAAQIQSGQLSEQSLLELVHEMRHGADAGFGSVSGVRAAAAGKLLQARTYTPQEVAYAAPFVSRYDPAKRERELSAYAAEYSIAKPLYAQMQARSNLAELHQGVGFGGIIFDRFSRNQLGGINTTGNAAMAETVAAVSAKSKSLLAEIQTATGAGAAPTGLLDRVGAQVELIERFQAKASQPVAKATASVVTDPWGEAKTKVAETTRAVGTLAVAAGKVAKPVAGAAMTAYNFAQGIENAVLPLVPFGKEIKAVGQGVALPALAYAGVGMLPGGQVMQGALGAGARGLLSLPGGAASGALTNAAAGAFGGIPLVGSGLSTAISGLISGAIESGVGALVPVLAGKAVLGLGQKAVSLALPGGQSQPALAAGQSIGQRAIAGAKGLVSVEVSPLDAVLEGRGTAPALPGSRDSAWVKEVAGKFSIAYARIQKALKAGNAREAKAIAAQIDQQANDFIAEIESLKTELGDKTGRTTEGGKLLSIQSAIARKRNRANQQLKKIQQVDDEELRLSDSEELRIFTPQQRRRFNTNEPLSAKDSKQLIQQANASQRRYGQVAAAVDEETSKRLQEATQKANNELARLDRGEEPTNKLTTGLTKLGGAAKLAIGAFAGFQIGQIIVTQFGAAIKDTVALTSEFEQLQLQLQAATGSLESGRQRFSAIRAEARGLGISQAGALATGARIAGTTLGTELEGAPTELFTTQINKIAKARGLSRSQVDGLSTAISQMLGNPRVMTEELNQLRESGGITNARTLGANALGLTPQQFSKQLESGAGIDSRKFVSAFLSQASSDSLLIEDEALNTQASKVAKLQGAYESLQLTIGDGISPAFKAGLDALTGGLDLLTKGVEIGSTLLIGLAVRSIPLVVGGLVSLGRTAIATGINLQALGSALTGLAGLAVKFAVFYAIGESVKFLAQSMKDAGEDTRRETAKIKDAFDKLNGTTVKVTLDLPKNPSEIQGEDWAQNFLLGAERALGDSLTGLVNTFNPGGTQLRFVGQKEKEQEQKGAAISEALRNVSGNLDATGATIGKAKQLNQIDLQLQQLSSKQSALFVTNPGDAAGLAAINRQYKELYQTRTNLAQQISPAQAAIQQQLNQLKGEKDALETLKSNKQITAGEYTSRYSQIGAAIKQVESAQIELNKAIKSPLDDLAAYTRSLDLIAAKYEGLTETFTKLENAQKRSRNDREISGQFSAGQAEFRALIDQQTTLAEKIKLTAASIKDMTAQLNQIDPQQISQTLSNYGLNLDTTTAAELTAIANSTTNALDKEVLTRLATIKQRQLDLDNYSTAINDSQAALSKKIKAENLEIEQYYRSIIQGIDRNDVQSQTLISKIATARNRFQTALAGFSESLADGFFGAITDLLLVSQQEIENKAELARTKTQNQRNLTNQLNDINLRRNSLTSPVAPVPEQIPSMSGQSQNSSSDGERLAAKAESTIGMYKGVAVQCANAVRALAKLAGVKLAVTDAPADASVRGIGRYTNPARANSFGGKNDLVITNPADVRRGDIVQWRDSYEGINGIPNDNEITHVGVALGGGRYWHHGKAPGTRINNADGLKFYRALRVNGLLSQQQQQQQQQAANSSTQGSYSPVNASFYFPGEGDPRMEGGKKDWRGRYLDGNMPAVATRTTGAPGGIPDGAILEIRDPRTGKTTRAKVLDRGPLFSGRDIDLTPAVARALGIKADGIAGLEARVVSTPSGTVAPQYDLGVGNGRYDRKGRYIGQYGKPIIGQPSRKEGYGAGFAAQIPLAQFFPFYSQEEKNRQNQLMLERGANGFGATGTGSVPLKNYATPLNPLGQLADPNALNRYQGQLERMYNKPSVPLNELPGAEKIYGASARARKAPVGSNQPSSSTYTPQTAPSTADLEQVQQNTAAAQSNYQEAIGRYNSSIATLDAIAEQAKKDKEQADALAGTIFEQKQSETNLRRAQGARTLRSQRRIADKTARDRQRDAGRTVLGFSSAISQSDQEAQQWVDLENRINDSREVYNDLKESYDNAIATGQEVIRTLSSKPKNQRTVDDNRSLEETTALVNSFTAKRDLLIKDTNVAEAAYNEARAALRTAQSLKRRDDRQALYFQRRDSLASLDETRQSRAELAAQSMAPYANDDALDLKERNQQYREALALDRAIADIEKQRRTYQRDDGSRIDNSILFGQRKTQVARSTDPKLGLAEQEAAKREIERIDSILALNDAEDAAIVNAEERAKLITEQIANERNLRSIERKNYAAGVGDAAGRSQLSLAQARTEGRRAFGLDTRLEDYNQAVTAQRLDYAQQKRSLEAQKEAITGTDQASIEARDHIDELIDRLGELNQVKLDNLANGFDEFNQVLSDVQKQTRSVLGDFVTTGKFDIGSIFRAGLNSVIGKNLDRGVSDLFGGLFRQQSQPQGDMFGSIAGTLVGLLGFADGDRVSYAPTQANLAKGNGPIAKALQKESRLSGRRAILATLSEDERVLNYRENQAYERAFPNGILGFAFGGPVKRSPLNLAPNKSAVSGFDREAIRSSKDININVTGDYSGANDPAAARQLVNAFRSIVTEELINHRRQRTGVMG